jgi:uncharacterized protein (TIGR03437 family)
MKRTFSILALALLVCAAASAATINTTLTVNATGSLTGASIAATGTATLTTVGSGTFAATLSLTPDASQNYSAPFTITLTGGAGTITGTLKIPTALLSGSGTGSATITGGTGTYVNATGSFPSLAGTGSINTTTFAITLTFTGAGTITTGGAPPVPVPTITAVQDAGSYTNNVAEGSIFVVKGTTLSASGYTAMSFPLPTSSSGVKITFTPAAGGTGTDAYLVYLYNQGGVNQLAGVLPSGLAVGNYNVTVTNGTVSAPFPTQVVQRKLGLITADSTGSGLAVIQNYISASQLDIDRFTTFASGGYTFSPSRPGQVLIAWATGMGPVAGGDNTASPGYDFNANGVNVKVLVGGVSITPLYAGRAPGLAGADQINFALPSNIPTGCTVSFQVSVNGVLSNPAFIAIAQDATSSACVIPGYTTAQLQKLDQGGTITTGGFSIEQFTESLPQLGTVKEDIIGGGFSQITGFQLSSAACQNVSLIQSGSCTVIQGSCGGSSTSTGSVKSLDAGKVTISGPSGSGLTSQALTETSNSYSLIGAESGISIPGQVNFTLPAGSYTLAGAGGNDVGSFSTSLTLATAITVTGGLPSTVPESSPLTINWTGGNASDMLEIVGASSTNTGTGANQVTTSTEFICVTTAGAKTFTVPSSILTQLPAAANGSLLVLSGNNSATFSATLKADGSTIPGTFGSFVGVGAAPAYTK